MAQTASITGLGSERFQSAHDGLYVCAERLSRHLPEDQVPSLRAKTFHGFAAIGASNRYYTYKGAHSSSPVVPFAEVVDPLNALRDMSGKDFEHTQDNEVSYLTCLETADGNAV